GGRGGGRLPQLILPCRVRKSENCTVRTMAGGLVVDSDNSARRPLEKAPMGGRVTHSNPRNLAVAGPYQVFMLVLCGLALLFLAANTFVHWDSSTKTILTYADDAICVLFLIDFCITFARAPRKWQYFRTWG